MEDGIVNKDQAWGPFFCTWCAEDLTPQASRDLFALAVAGAATRRGCVASVADLAGMVGVHPARFQARLSDLSERGMLTTKRRGAYRPSVRRFTDAVTLPSRSGRFGVPFAMMPAAALGLKGSALRVAAAIQWCQTHNDDDDGWCWRTVEELADDACVSSRSVSSALRELRALGVLSVVAGGYGRRLAWQQTADGDSIHCPPTRRVIASQPNSDELRYFRYLDKNMVPERTGKPRSPGVIVRDCADDHLERWDRTASPLERRLADELTALPVIARHWDPRMRVAAVIAIASVFAERADWERFEGLARSWAAAEAAVPSRAPLARFLGLAWAVAVPSVHDRRREPDAVKERFEAERLALRSAIICSVFGAKRPRTPK